MAAPHDIRRLAFRTLFEIDAMARCDPPQDLDVQAWEATLGDSVEDPARFKRQDLDKALLLARTAFSERAKADDAMNLLAPLWPASRQAAVDRAILRLAFHEISRGLAPPKVAINEAVDLAKEFGGEKSPGFVNALLDKAFETLMGKTEASAVTGQADPAPDENAPPASLPPSP